MTLVLTPCDLRLQDEADVEPGEDVRPGPALPVLRDQHVRSRKQTKAVLLRGVDPRDSQRTWCLSNEPAAETLCSCACKEWMLCLQWSQSRCRGEPAHKAFGVPTDKVLEVGLIYTI